MEKESICKRCKHAIRCCDMILDDNDDDYWFVCELSYVHEIELPVVLKSCPYYEIGEPQ